MDELILLGSTLYVDKSLILHASVILSLLGTSTTVQSSLRSGSLLSTQSHPSSALSHASSADKPLPHKKFVDGIKVHFIFTA